MRKLRQTRAATYVMAGVSSNLTVNVNSAATCSAISAGTYETVQITTGYLSALLPPPFSGYTISVCASYAM